MEKNITFEQALEWLAKKWPEIFNYVARTVQTTARIYMNRQGEWRYVGDITQDDIDEILGEIGWEWQPSYTSDGGWYFFVWPIKYRDMQDYDNDIGFNDAGEPLNYYETKLATARAALIAVVEEEKK